MSRFRIDHLDGPRFDSIEGRYYGAGSVRGTLSSGNPSSLLDFKWPEKKINTTVKKSRRDRPRSCARDPKK